MKEAIVTAYIADAYAGEIPQAAARWIGTDPRKGGPNTGRQQKGAQALVPKAPPLIERYPHAYRRRFRTRNEAVDTREIDCFRRPAMTLGKQKPAIFGQSGEELLANGNDVYARKGGDQIFEQRYCIRRMPDFCGHNECHATAALEQPSRRDEEGRPGGTQPAEPGAQAAAQVQGGSAHVAFEDLVANEGRIAHGTLEPLACLARPSEEIALMHEGPGARTIASCAETGFCSMPTLLRCIARNCRRRSWDPASGRWCASPPTRSASERCLQA